MEFAAGFDMVPRLTKSSTDQAEWDRFIQSVKTFYNNDGVVNVKSASIVFNISGHPSLPLQCEKFLRFSARTTGAHFDNAQEYISMVCEMATAVFGARIHLWVEGDEASSLAAKPHYGLSEVLESQKAYEQSEGPEIEQTSEQLAIGTTAVSEEVANNVLFRVQSIAGKGRGLVANKEIAKGTRIIAERPLFKITGEALGEVFERAIFTKVAALSESSKQQFSSLCSSRSAQHPLSSIVRTNALPCGVGSVTAAVYATICLINHSCVHNAHHSWNERIGAETIHAERYIAAGEEITISYDEGNVYHERMQNLQDSFGFTCTCKLCSLPNEERRKSDANLREVKKLDRHIGNGTHIMNAPEACLQDCRRVLELLTVEYGECPLILATRAWYDAFQVCITHGDVARGRVFLTRRYRDLVLCEGENSMTTPGAKALRDDPTSHRNYGITMRWQRGKNNRPKGLSAEAFEKWLWREK